MHVIECSGWQRMCDGLASILTSRPDGAGLNTVSTWLRMEPLTLDLLNDFWLVDAGTPLIDVFNMELLTNIKKGNKRYSGVFLRNTEEKVVHGIVRIIDSDKELCTEGTYKFGLPHGLHRVTDEFGSRLELYLNGDRVATLSKDRHELNQLTCKNLMTVWD